MAEVDTAAVLRVLRPVWERVPETASRVRQRIEAVLDAARVKGWRIGENPARWKGHLAGELPQPGKVKRVEHRPALPWERMGEFIAALDERDGIAALALRFVILTAARSGEVRKMRWREVDLGAKVWTVPGERMKAGKTHRVPLSPAALEALETVRPLAKGAADLVFPSVRKNVPLSDMTLSEVVRRMNEGGEPGARPRWCDAGGRAVVPHGFRASFRMWAGETRPEGREVVEMALAHTIKDKAEASYARSDLLEKRRPLMDAWAEQCARLPAEVVALGVGGGARRRSNAAPDFAGCVPITLLPFAREKSSSPTAAGSGGRTFSLYILVFPVGTAGLWPNSAGFRRPDLGGRGQDGSGRHWIIRVKWPLADEPALYLGSVVN